MSTPAFASDLAGSTDLLFIMERAIGAATVATPAARPRPAIFFFVAAFSVLRLLLLLLVVLARGELYVLALAGAFLLRVAIICILLMDRQAIGYRIDDS